MSAPCMLVLTQGTHVIDDTAAMAVEVALANGVNVVEIDIDMTGSGNVLSRACISMAHVIAVIRHPERAQTLNLTNDSNVYALRAR